MVNILKSGDKRNKKTINQDGFELKNVPMNNMSFSSLPPPKSAHPCIHVFILSSMEWSVGVVVLQGDMIGVGHIMLLVASAAFLTIILHSPLFNQYCMDSYYYFVQGDRKKSNIRVVRQVKKWRMNDPSLGKHFSLSFFPAILFISVSAQTL